MTAFETSREAIEEIVARLETAADTSRQRVAEESQALSAEITALAARCDKLAAELATARASEKTLRGLLARTSKTLDGAIGRFGAIVGG